MKNFCFLLLLVALQACTSSVKKGGGVHEKSYDFKKTIDITCQQVELPATIEMMYWALDDSLLYIRSTDTEFFFYTFRLSDFSRVDSCGRKGQGPDEWNYPNMSVMPGGGMLVQDKMALYTLKGREVTKLAPFKRFENIDVLQMHNYPMMGYMSYSPQEVCWKYYDVKTGGTKDSIRYVDDTNAGRALQEHEFFWDFMKDDKVVLAHLTRDEYTILELKNDTIDNVQLYKGNDEADNESGYYYGDVECTDKYIFLLSHKRQESGHREAMEVEVYDYEGNPVYLLKLGIIAQHMLLDKSHKRLLLLSPADDYVYVANLDFEI